LPDLLSKFDSPSAIINECFEELLNGIRNYPKTQILFALVIVASSLKKCMKRHSFEKSDLQLKFDRIVVMINECLKSESMYKLENIARILQDTNNQHKLGNEKLAISMARSFEAGPLVYCLEYELHEILGIEKVGEIANLIFNLIKINKILIYFFINIIDFEVCTRSIGD